MRYLIFLSILLQSLTGCDVKANKVNGEDQGVNLDLSKIDNVVKSKDNNEKIKYFNALLVKAENNDPVAQNLVGVVFENGYLNQNKDIKKSIYWYEKAIKNNNGVAENNMGSLYAHGNGVKQDYEKAYSYYKGAMSKNVPEAINSIGFMYFNGFYFEKDLKKACEYYEKSANFDYGLGAANTANCYFEGWGGVKDKHKYFDYSLKAAEKDYAPSQFNVAVMYKKGEVIDKSIDKSVYWYKKAIENSEPRAAYNLASLYEKGDGVKQDFDLAYAYYTLAKEFGLDVAQKKLLELDSKVVKENIRILKNGDSIQIAVDDPSSKWEIMDEEDYLKKNKQ